MLRQRLLHIVNHANCNSILIEFKIERFFLMQIVHIFKTYFPHTMGGCEQVIKNIALSTTRYGCSHKLLTVTPDSTPIVDNLDEISVSRYPKTLNVSSCPISWQLYRNFKQEIQNADILHYHFPWPYGDFLHLTSKVKAKKNIVTYHSDIIKQKTLNFFYKPLMHKFFRKMDAIVPTSQNLLDTSTSLSRYKNKCTPIPIGIDESNYFPLQQDRIESFKQKFGNNFILFIGALRYYKGLEFLLKALVNTKVKVVIAGAGLLEKELKHQALVLRLNNVHFLDFVTNEDKSALLKLCRAVVLPSHLRTEAFGIALIEGLMFAKPLISTELGTGTSYVNEDKKTGFVVQAGNVLELRTALDTLFHNVDLAEQMGQESRKRFEKYFMAGQMGYSYVELYKKILI